MRPREPPRQVDERPRIVSSPEPHISRSRNMTGRLFRRLTSLLTLAGCVSFLVLVNADQQSPAETPSVTFQVEVNYVDIDAVVTDERGNFVAGLSKEDFELFEDGKPQQIST